MPGDFPIDHYQEFITWGRPRTEFTRQQFSKISVLYDIRIGHGLKYSFPLPFHFRVIGQNVPPAFRCKPDWYVVVGVYDDHLLDRSKRRIQKDRLSTICSSVGLV